MLMQNLGGQTKSIMVFCEVAYGMRSVEHIKCNAVEVKLWSCLSLRSMWVSCEGTFLQYSRWGLSILIPLTLKTVDN